VAWAVWIIKPSGSGPEWNGYRLSLKTGEAMGPAHVPAYSLGSGDFRIELHFSDVATFQ